LSPSKFVVFVHRKGDFAEAVAEFADDWMPKAEKAATNVIA
jgi:hypothetical protein